MTIYPMKHVCKHVKLSADYQPVKCCHGIMNKEPIYCISDWKSASKIVTVCGSLGHQVTWSLEHLQHIGYC